MTKRTEEFVGHISSNQVFAMEYPNINNTCDMFHVKMQLYTIRAQTKQLCDDVLWIKHIEEFVCHTSETVISSLAHY